MARQTCGSIWSALLLFGALLVPLAIADQISYCSNQNNAGSYPAFWDEYQSNGLCRDHCQGSYAFSILQGNYCWCSNYSPVNQEDTSYCNEGCPGIDTELCGSTDAGLFAYFLLAGGDPLGTSGDGSVASSTSSSAQPTTLTSAPSPPASSTPANSFSASSSPSPSPTEVYTSVTTVTGQVRTVIVTPSATSDATLGQSSTSGGSGVSTGKVVGIVVGVALGLGLIIGGAVWWCLGRRHRKSSRGPSPDGSFTPQTTDGSSNTIPSRQVSQMSQAGLLSRNPRLQTNGLPPGNDLRSADTMSSNLDRRSVGTDQRLNPYALYSHEERNMSSVSLQDNQDYSRQLRIANPDL